MLLIPLHNLQTPLPHTPLQAQEMECQSQYHCTQCKVRGHTSSRGHLEGQ